MIKAVVFDLDDTLISEKEYIRSGFEVVSEKISNENNIDYYLVYEVMLKLFYESSKHVYNRLLDYFNVDYDEDYIKSLLKIYRNHIPKINLYNDAKDIIDTLYNRNLKLGIITDGYVETQKNKLKVLNINNYFDYILITDELGKKYWKPHRKPYDIMKEQLNVCYEEMVYIGDNVSKDFVTPNKLGMKSIMINRMDGVYKNNTNIDKIYMPQLIVNNLNEIGGIV